MGPDIPEIYACEDFKGEWGELEVAYGKAHKVIFLGLGKKMSFAKVLRIMRILSKKHTKFLSSQISLSLTHGSLNSDQPDLLEAAVAPRPHVTQLSMVK